MQRLGTALVALLALVALAGAAGTFATVEGPSVAGDGAPTGATTPPDPPPATGVPAGASDSAVQRAATPTAAAAGDSGGVSPLVVPAVGGSLLAAGLLVVVLTGHDVRVPAVPEDDSGGGDPTPSVSPAYDSPAENTVTRAWRTLRDRVRADETATPGDVAGRALDRGLPDESVERITERFRAVRYGDEEPTAAESDRAEAAAESLDAADGDGGSDPPDGR